jgi:hypothetical protein
MSQYETSHRTAGARRTGSAGAGTPLAADSPNVMARLPDIGLPDRDLDRDLPMERRGGRVLSSRLAMPILMGAGLILLVVALAPFLLGNKDGEDVSELGPPESEAGAKEEGQWYGPPSGDPNWNTRGVDPQMPGPGPQWNGTTQPQEWSGQPLPQPGQHETAGVNTIGQPGDVPWPVTPSPEQSPQWSTSPPMAVRPGPPQPAPFNVESQAPQASTVEAAGPWQRLPENTYRGDSAAELPDTARTPIPPLGPSSTVQQGATQSTAPLVTSRTLAPGSYQGGYQPSPAASGYYQQPIESGYGPPRSSANQPQTIGPHSVDPSYGGAFQQGAGTDLPQTYDRWSPPGAPSGADGAGRNQSQWDGRSQIQPAAPPLEYDTERSHGQYNYQSGPSPAYPQAALSQPSAGYAAPGAVVSSPGSISPPTPNPAYHTRDYPPAGSYPAPGSYYGSPSASGQPGSYSTTDPGTSQIGGRIEQTTRW